MAILISNACHSSYGRLTYVFNQSAHCDAKTTHRVLACSGNNIKMLHDPATGQISNIQSGAYLEKQFHQSLKKAFNPKRKIQCQSIIISFSDDEFDTNDLQKQASQALKLVQGYVYKHFDDAQTVSCVQCDSQGGRLHVHLLINAVKPNGQTIPTNRFSVFKMRRNLNDYLSSNFERVTGRTWSNPFQNRKSRQDLQSLPNRSSWESQLKKVINNVKSEVTNVKDFLSKLSKQGITVTTRRKGKSWAYHQTVKTSNGPKKMSARDFYQRRNKKTGEVVTTRGLGTNFTKQSLEQYWQAQLVKLEEINLEEPKMNVHHRKEADNNGQRQEQEQLQKIKTRAAEARAQVERRRELNRLTLRQQRAAETEEQRHQRRHRQESRQSKGLGSRRNHSITEQARIKRLEQQRIKAKQQSSKSSRTKDDGPEL